MPLRLALAGNPNSGKTTLFNELTGATARVGNWPGVTIDRKEGAVRGLGEAAVLVDLPGIYSLSPYTPEEVVSRNYLTQEAPDAIINIVDATNLARNLYLTTQLMELDIPVVIALNMSDEVEKKGDTVDSQALSGLLGVPVVAISALRGQGLKALMDATVAAAHAGRHGYNILDTSVLGPAINSVRGSLDAIGYPSAHFHAVKLLENDRLSIADPHLAGCLGTVLEAQQQAQAALPPGDSPESAIAALRYRWIAAYAQSLVIHSRPSMLRTASDAIDKWLTHPLLGIPLFLAFMFCMFHLTFSENLLGLGIPGPGVYLQGLMEVPISWLSGWLGGALAAGGASAWAQGLLIDGVIAGVGAVLSFVPQIMMLFLFLSLLEDSGYMARAAYIMDRALRRFGLSGRAFLPMLMGFGCSVPALLATRTLETEKTRRMTMLMIPYMSCGAKAPIWAIFAAALFPRQADVVVFGIYLLGILTAVVSALLFKRVLYKTAAAPLIIELPPYRLPKLKNSLLLMWQKLREYVVRAGTVILLATMAIWFLSSFTWGLTMVAAGSGQSILATIGNAIRWFFIPLGFASGPDGWKAAVAILTGLLAKEAVVSTLGVLYNPDVVGDALEGGTAQGALLAALAASFSPLAALSYMAFNLLSIPCMAAVAAMRAEMRSPRWTAVTLGVWVGTAWLVSFLIYNVGRLLGF
ncbi:MAG: ferrous iron transport protein B [Oscillospiraceae bacterium]|jgi:ferrous iron transport protein B|nr:ferrous iron transport protein B [Oscillospiraceae bacterium]